MNLSIISFDASRDAAAIEAREDRSLNLILRQRRLRSEIFRLNLAPDSEQVELLADILANGPQRPIVFLARELERHPPQHAAIQRLAPFGTRVLIVVIGGPVQAWADVSYPAQVISLATDDADEIQALADRILAENAVP